MCLGLNSDDQHGNESGGRGASGFPFPLPGPGGGSGGNNPYGDLSDILRRRGGDSTRRGAPKD